MVDLWAVLATATGKLIHTRRAALSFEWILALLEAEKAPLVRTVRAIRETSGAILITDASTWGLGGDHYKWKPRGIFFMCNSIMSLFEERKQNLVNPNIWQYGNLWHFF